MPQNGWITVLAASAVLLCGWGVAARPAGAQVVVGTARVDVTPEFPVRLSGYANRRAEHEGVEQRLWTKALAIGSDEQGPTLLVSLETCALPPWLADEVHKRIHARHGIPRERFALCATHTHSAPYFKGGLPTMFGEPIPAEHQAHIDRYADWVLERVVEASLKALADRRSARLAWGQGTAGFAKNRRFIRPDNVVQLRLNPQGVVDHAMPMLRVTDTEGNVRAIVVNYACHCTTLGGEFNKVCGDWAGYAQEYVEAEYPGSTCMVLIGCGADANPEPRLELEHARQHGRTIADEVERLANTSLVPVAGPPVCRFQEIPLPFDQIPSRQEWEKRAERKDASGYQAKLILERLNRDETLPTELAYPVQTWVFGNELAMVFLGGEVVVDYALRLKEELDGDRLWITAYANDVPCYIPSRRILAEGGYEAQTSMIYYNQPARLAPAVEDLVITTVHGLMPEGFRTRQPAPAEPAAP